jgi:transposase-like protein
MRDAVRYSEAFKLRLAGDVAGGKYQSLEEARRRNGIRGADTLNKWLKQYGREDMLPKRVRAGTMNETGELKAARNRMFSSQYIVNIISGSLSNQGIYFFQH